MRKAISATSRKMTSLLAHGDGGVGSETHGVEAGRIVSLPKAVAGQASSDLFLKSLIVDEHEEVAKIHSEMGADLRHVQDRQALAGLDLVEDKEVQLAADVGRCVTIDLLVHLFSKMART